MSILGTLANVGNALLPGHPFVGQTTNNGKLVNNGYPGVTLDQITAPQNAPQTQDTSTSPGTYSTGTTAPNANLVAGFNNQKQGIYSSANDAAANAGIGLHSSILDFLDSLKTGQNKIDTDAVQAELAKKQGIQGVLDMVGRGIRSGGVILANKNAANSSGAEALARAYSQLGREQASGVGNQYAQDENNISQEQVDQNTQEQAGVRKLGESKIQTVNSIVSAAQDKLAALDASMANASMPDRINLEAEKNTIRNSALTALQQYDQELQQGVAGIAPSSSSDRMAKAQGLATAGVAAANPFTLNSQAPAQFQNTGPFASELPIFTLPRTKQTA